jgi:ubiquinone/menaquinone biosynthesis C-methylase UbiE
MTDTHDKKSEETWDSIAKSFDSTRSKPWTQCIDFINKLPESNVIADIGCGNGRHLIPAAKHCKMVIGLDISRELLNIVKSKIDDQKLKNVLLLHSDVVNIPLEDGCVDSILFIATLHNIQGRARRVQSLKEVNRILKKDGTALISVWSRWQDKYRRQFFKRWFTRTGKTEFGDIDIYWRQHGLDIPRFYHLYSKREFLKDIRDSGLKILEIEDVSMHSKKHPDNYFALTTRS